MSAPVLPEPGRSSLWGRVLTGAGLLVYAFLYLPLIILILYSFNAAQVNSWPISQWSTAAYGTLASDSQLLASIQNSLYVSSIAVAIAVILGTAAALGFARLRIPGKEVFSFAVTLPIVLPGIVTGIAMLTLFTDINYNLSLNTIIVGHVTFCIVLVFNSVRARLARVPAQLSEAARDLGAGPFRTFWYVTLPSIRTAVISGTLLAFTLSFDEVVVSFFLAGRDNTLPLEIWSRLRRGTISPELNAVATLVIAVTVVLVFIAQAVVREEA
jgi:spermidine/putrescine transport system permease protein